MMLQIFICVAGLTLPGVSSQGDRIFYHDARSMSLGGVSVVLENTANPASMGLFDKRTVRLSGQLSVQNEGRGLRVYDSFGNNIGIATVANNTGTYLSPGACSFIFPVSMLRVGLEYAPIWDHNYSYREEHRDDFYQIIRIDELRHRGYVQAVAPMVALNYRFISLGVENAFLMGKRVVEETVIIPQLADTVSSEEATFDGSRIKIGIEAAPTMNFRVAYTYQHHYELADVGYEYPETHVIGIMYQPPGRIPTKFLAQIEAEMWEGIIGDNIFIYKIGVEHMILRKYNLRYGFCVFPDYTQSVIWTTNLTFGFGFHTDLYSLDIGYCYGKRDYLAADYIYLILSENYKFDETTHHFVISTGIQF
jgi:hypothetical protein